MLRILKNNKIHIDKTWSLFLDRDGVINKRIMGGYVTSIDQFEFLPGVLDIFPMLAEQFGKIFVVTNQQGIGKGLMTEEDLAIVHEHMKSGVQKNGGRIDAVYHAPHLAEAKSIMRKPQPGMAQKAQNENPIVNFERAIMVGDTDSDIKFGKSVGMVTVFVQSSSKMSQANPDFVIPSLKAIEQIIEA